MLKLTNKLPSVTLLETVISSVILLIAYSIMLFVFLSYSGSNNTDKMVSLNLRIDEIFRDQKEQFLDGERKIYFGGYVMDKKVLPYENRKDLFIIKIDVTRNDGKFLFSRQRIMQKPDEKR